MNKLIKMITCAFLLCLTTPSFADTLKIGVGISKPPYVIQSEHAGVELDIVRRALELAGHKIEPHYMPLLRIPYQLNAGGLDGGMHLRAHIAIDGFYSDEVINYRNFAITLEKENLEVHSLDDLKDKTVLAFQNAKKLLGERFFKVVDKNKGYSEIANQELQVRMLAAGRAQVAIADFRIFLHFKNVFEKKIGKKIAFRYHPIFPPTPYRAGFRDRMIRDDFDRGLAKLHESGEYEQIVRKYIPADELDAIEQVLSQ